MTDQLFGKDRPSNVPWGYPGYTVYERDSGENEVMIVGVRGIPALVARAPIFIDLTAEESEGEEEPGHEEDDVNGDGRSYDGDGGGDGGDGGQDDRNDDDNDDDVIVID
eukprot:m.261668 g.261668  ORF g.261668 m.261668 type:complete len:109 (+) comp40448_c0_seq21:2215-2541(+)